MLIRKSIEHRALGDPVSPLEAIFADDLADALLHLEQRELIGLLKLTSCPSVLGCIIASPELAAELLKLIILTVGGEDTLLIGISESDGKLKIEARADGYSFSLKAAAKITRLASLAGFTASFDGGGFTFTAEIKSGPALSVYAISKQSLIKIFLKYFS